MYLVFILATLIDTFYFPLKINVNLFKDKGSEGVVTSESTMTKLFMKKVKIKDLHFFIKDSTYNYSVEGEYKVHGRKIDLKLSVKGKDGFYKKHIFTNQTYKNIADSIGRIFDNLKRTVKLYAKDTFLCEIESIKFTIPAVIKDLPLYKIKAQLSRSDFDTTIFIPADKDSLFIDLPEGDQKIVEKNEKKVLIKITGPSETKVYIDKKFYGEVPLSVEISPGLHTILFDNPLWGTKEREINVEIGKEIVIDYFSEGGK